MSDILKYWEEKFQNDRNAELDHFEHSTIIRNEYNSIARAIVYCFKNSSSGLTKEEADAVKWAYTELGL